MDPSSLVSVCAIAFTAVFSLLTLLALAMHGITLLFPARAAAVDPAIVAAISSVVASALDGAIVSHIEEER